MAFESLKKERGALTKEQKEILQDIGMRGLATLEKLVDDLDPNWEGTKYFQQILEEMWEPVTEEYGPGGIELKSGISEKEADEILEAQRELAKKEEEHGEEGLPLTKEEAPWALEEEKKGRIQKIFEGIKKLFK